MEEGGREGMFCTVLSIVAKGQFQVVGFLILFLLVKKAEKHGRIGLNYP
jgi:hypothetical protein